MRNAAPAVLAALLAACASAPGEEIHLRSARPLDSRFLHLRADGTFQFYARARMSLTEGLRGTWRRDGPDGAALRCDRWARQVVCDPFRVRFGTDWERHRRRVRDDLTAFLRDHPGRPYFSREELEDRGTWEEELPGAAEAVTVVPISVLEERVPRAAVERLLAALDAYGAGGDPREIHVRFHRHRSVEFAEWLDWSAYGDPVSPGEIRADIDRLGPGETLADAWVRLGRDAFERDLTGGDGLRFFKKP